VTTRRLADHLLESWTRRGFTAWLLLPIAAIYGLLTSIRRQAFRLGLAAPQRVKPLVIVVGNVIAGGAGKTPTTISVINYLVSKGYSVGVVSRGYGRSNSQTRLIASDSTPDMVGDEPLLIHQATGAPVAVADRRYDAAIALIERHPDLQILICDDGLQHYALYRDIEICVFDDRGIGNGWLLPSGPLREHWPLRPIPEIGQAPSGPLFLTTRTPEKTVKPATSQQISMGFNAERKLADYAIDKSGRRIPIDTLNKADRPISALAGIARPTVFFDMLRMRGVSLYQTLALDDHAEINSGTVETLEEHTLLCTEKDARKLWEVFPKALAVPLQLDIEPRFFAALDQRLQTTLDAKLSSGHGH